MTSAINNPAALNRPNSMILGRNHTVMHSEGQPGME